MQLAEFMTSEHRNKYLSYPWLKVYVRKGVHVIDGQAVNTLDIANVTVDEDHRRLGIFTAFLEDAEAMADACGRLVYVENVMSEPLASFLERRGYGKVGVYPFSFHNDAISEANLLAAPLGGL